MEERDRSYRGVIAVKLNPFDLVDKKTYNQKNKDKSWEYKRYGDIDPNFICISRNGTIGEVWLVGGLKIALPTKSEDAILYNEGVSDNDSIWKRTEIPKEFLELEREYKREMRKYKFGNKRNIVKKKYATDKYLLEKKHSKFINKEFDKRKNGLHIKIDNEIVYITGENYMFLNYYYLAEDKIYPNFRMTAVHTWWHWEAICADKSAWGELRLKSRRVAWTVEACSIGLNKLTLTRYAEIPIVSETDRLGRKLFKGKIVNSFKYYPTYFKPLSENPNAEVANNLEVTFDTDDQETSVISVYPTKAVAYDSLKATYSINDEVGKYTNTTFTEFRGNHRDCHFKGLVKVVSKGKFGSTAGAFANGGESYQYEFESANPLNRDVLGRTETGLVSLFVDCCYTSAGFFDKWGFPIVFDPTLPIENEDGDVVELGAITAWNLEAEKKKKGKATDYNNFLRNQPRTPEHAFRNEGGVNNDFDIDNLNDHYDYLDQYPADYLNERIIFRGNLAWKGEPFDSDVEWKPNTKGRFQTTWIPDPDLQNKHSIRNYHGMKLQMPENGDVGAFGVDSYDIIGNTTSGKGSDGAIVGYTKFNMKGAPSHSFFLIYKDRPKKRNDFYDDVIMACQFFGMYALIENNKARLLEYIYDKGFSGYSLRRQDKKWKDLSEMERLWGGIPSSTPVIEDQASLLKDYIVDNVGQDLDNECKVYHKPLIKEWINFNLKKRKEYDLGVASGMAIMAVQYRVKKRVPFSMSGGKGVAIGYFGA